MSILVDNNSNLEKKYYIINYPFETSGLFCICIYIIYYSLYALNHGYIPVVDLKHNNNQYFKDNRVFKDNVWEYFFEQPCGVNLDDINDDLNITISGMHVPIEEDIFQALTDIKKYREKFKQIFDIFKINKQTQEFLESNYNNIVKGEKEVLGIICRGSDYVTLKLPGHNIQPDPKDVLEKAKEVLAKYRYKKIWLATEDANIYKMFKAEFGDMLLENSQYMFSNTGDKYIADIKVNRPNHFYTLAMEYLSSVYIISKCKYIIGGTVTGTIGAWLLSKGFENQSYIYLWNLGRYGIRVPIKYRNIFEKIFSVKFEFFENTKYPVITIFCKKKRLKFLSSKVNNFIEAPYISNF